MKLSHYQQAFNKVQASDQFKSKVISSCKRRRRMAFKKIGLSIAACMLIAVGIFMFTGEKTETVAVGFDLTERIVVDENAVSADVMVNIEGVIVEVSEDGYGFKLDSGQWIVVNEETVIGMTAPTAVAKEEQFFEPTFRIGNSVVGFTENEASNEIIAFAIYTNWNWDDPIK